MTSRKIEGVGSSLLLASLFGNVSLSKDGVDDQDWDIEMQQALIHFGNVLGNDVDGLAQEMESSSSCQTAIHSHPVANVDSIDYYNIESEEEDRLQPTSESASQTLYKNNLASHSDTMKENLALVVSSNEFVKRFPSFRKNGILKFSDLFYDKKLIAAVKGSHAVPESVKVETSSATSLLKIEEDDNRIFLDVVSFPVKLQRKTAQLNDSQMKMLSLSETKDFFPTAVDDWETRITWEDPRTDARDHSLHEDTPFDALSKLLPKLANHSLEQVEWENYIKWSNEDERDCLHFPLLLDLNDDHMLFDTKFLHEFQSRKKDAISGAHALKIMLKHAHAKLRKKTRDAAIGRPSFFLHESSNNSLVERHAFNISNDQYYETNKSRTGRIKQTVGKSVVQHSLPAYKLQVPLFNTHFTKTDMRQWHHGRCQIVPFVNIVFTPVKHTAISNHPDLMGDVMKTTREICLHDNVNIRFALVEYSEEYPPVIMNVGMATLINNFYRKKGTKDATLPRLSDGATVALEPTDISPFDRFGDVSPGSVVQTLVNNMFKAPLFYHAPSPTDFLALHYKGKLYLREIPAMYVAGQTLPQIEVPAPHSRKAAHYLRRRLHLFALRYFKRLHEKGNGQPLTTAEIVRNFPGFSEPTIRLNMRAIAQFHRVGVSGYWTAKQNATFPNEADLRALVTPEMECGYESMLAALQRLKDAGYSDTSRLVDGPMAAINAKRAARSTADEENDVLGLDEEELPEDEALMADMTHPKAMGSGPSHTLPVLDDDVKMAPWNVTNAFLAAQAGKIQLQVNGPADPTGRGEGISMIRLPSRAPPVAELSPKEKSVALFIFRAMQDGLLDLSNVSPQRARRWLIEAGVPAEDLMPLRRWELVARLRDAIFHAGLLLMDDSEAKKMARTSLLFQQAKFKQNLQVVWETQLKALAQTNVEDMDDDNEEGDGTGLAFPEDDLLFLHKPVRRDDPNVNALAEDIMRDLYGDERDESREQEKLTDWLKEAQDDPSQSQVADDTGSVASFQSSRISEQPRQQRTLRIERLMVWPNGERSWRTEIVKNTDVIDAYLAAKRAANPELAHTVAGDGNTTSFTIDRVPPKKRGRRPKPVDPALAALKRGNKPLTTHKCSACGTVGHVKSSRICPNYLERHPGKRNLMDLTLEGDLLKIEGTKISFSKTALQKAEDQRRQTLLTRVGSSSGLLAGARRRRADGEGSEGDDDEEYLLMMQRGGTSSARRRRSPEAWLAGILEPLWVRARDVPDSVPFHRAVLMRYAPDYYQIVKNPMDLGTIIEKVRKYQYRRAAAFLEDVKQIMTNCIIYNGAAHALSGIARDIVRVVEAGLVECREEIEEVELLLAKEEEEGYNPQVKRRRNRHRQNDNDSVSMGSSESGVSANTSSASMNQTATATSTVTTSSNIAVPPSADVETSQPEHTDEHIDILGTDY